MISTFTGPGDPAGHSKHIRHWSVDPDRIYLTGHILDAYNNQDLYAWFLKHRSQ